MALNDMREFLAVLARVDGHCAQDPRAIAEQSCLQRGHYVRDK